MARLMSVAKTRKEFTEGVLVHWNVINAIAGRELSVFSELPDFLNSSGICWEWSGDLIRIRKDVTRRSRWVKIPGGGLWVRGWSFLKPGDQIELIEWSPRVGPRWVCAGCGRFVRPDPEGGCCSGPAERRDPRRLGLREVVDVREERLKDITPVEVAREGFPGRSINWFISMYCGGKPDPDRPVNRIELRELAS